MMVDDYDDGSGDGFLWLRHCQSNPALLDHLVVILAFTFQVVRLFTIFLHLMRKALKISQMIMVITDHSNEKALQRSVIIIINAIKRKNHCNDW